MHIQADSGAIDPVATRETARGVPIRETATPRRGIGHVAANGTNTDNYGGRVILGVTNAGTNVRMAMHIADVERPLASAYRVMQAGNNTV